MSLVLVEKDIKGEKNHNITYLENDSHIHNNRHLRYVLYCNPVHFI